MTNVTALVSAHIDTAASLAGLKSVNKPQLLASLDAIKDMVEEYCENYLSGRTDRAYILPADASAMAGRLYEVAETLHK